MGGDYYDREVIPSKKGYDFGNTVIGMTKSLNVSLDPKIHVSNKGITANVASPIVISLDVTGSMGDWVRVSRA